MINDTFVILLIAHVVGDYYFQNQSLADNKKDDFNKLLLHCLIYTGISSIVFYFLFTTQFCFFTLFSVLHLLIDLSKFYLNKMANRYLESDSLFYVGFKKWQYVIDQLLHVVSILIIANFLSASNIVIFGNVIKTIGTYSVASILRVVLVVLLLLKPTNITFRELFSSAKPISKEIILKKGRLSKIRISLDVSNVKNGQIIGNIERLLLLLLLMVNQYSAIGIVFAAKSITRFNKISEDKEFAEYYLLGTLYSMLSTLVIYFIFFKI